MRLMRSWSLCRIGIGHSRLTPPIVLDKQASFFKIGRRYTDLNQAEDFSPLGSSPLPDPHSEIKVSGEKERKGNMNPLIQFKTTIAALVLLTCATSEKEHKSVRRASEPCSQLAMANAKKSAPGY